MCVWSLWSLQVSGGTGNCLTSLSSFKALYDAVDPLYKPKVRRRQGREGGRREGGREGRGRDGGEYSTRSSVSCDLGVCEHMYGAMRVMNRYACVTCTLVSCMYACMCGCWLIGGGLLLVGRSLRPGAALGLARLPQAPHARRPQRQLPQPQGEKKAVAGSW